jgi:hypothetical protein
MSLKRLLADIFGLSKPKNYTYYSQSKSSKTPTKSQVKRNISLVRDDGIGAFLREMDKKYKQVSNLKESQSQSDSIGSFLRDIDEKYGKVQYEYSSSIRKIEQSEIEKYDDDIGRFIQDMDRKYPRYLGNIYENKKNVDFSEKLKEVEKKYQLLRQEYTDHIQVERLQREKYILLKIDYDNLYEKYVRIRQDKDILETLINLPFIIDCRNQESLDFLPNDRKIVYFLQEEGGLTVKIGCTKMGSKRITNLQTSNPRKLKLIGYVEGGEAIERRFHQTYEKYKVKGSGNREWFYNPPLRFQQPVD